MTKLVFLDTETTSLNAETGEIWEVAAIVRHPAMPTDVEHHWLLPVTLEHADPISLSIGGFHERHPEGNDAAPREGHATHTTGINHFADQFSEITHGAHLVGAVVSFDEERLRRLLRRHHVMPSWHYHLLDVEALAAGHLGSPPPWRSDELSERLGVAPPSDEDRHTALGDARWARDIYDAVMVTQ